MPITCSVESLAAAMRVRLLDEFAAERARLLARRVPAAARIFLASIGAAAILEAVFHPVRTPALLVVYPVQALVCLVAARLVRDPRGPARAAMVAGAVAIVLGVLASAYLVAVQAPVDQLAVVLVCLLAGSSILLPWGGWVQLAVSLGLGAAFLVGAPILDYGPRIWTLGLPGFVVGALAVTGAFHLDRYRAEAYVHAAVQAEEARIAAVLTRVGETLYAHLRAPDLLDRVCRLAVESLGCEWSGVYLWDDEAQAYQLRGLSAPVDAGERAALAQLAPGRDDFPLLPALEQHDLIELEDSRRQGLVPAGLIERFRIASALYTPIRRAGTVEGVLIHGYSSRRGSFSASQHRLARGIAHIAAVAVDNARLIGQLGAASRLKSEFVATMSHELRTPLSVISGYTDLLDEGSFGPVTPEQHDTLGRIRQSAVTLLELVNMTLDLGRLENGRVPVTPTDVAVSELADEIQRDQQALVVPTVQHAWHVEPGLVVHVDRGKLKTILKNLVSNALKFTSAGRVDVEIGWRDGMLGLTVRDTGVGIAREDLAVVFEMFRQADGSASRRYEGVGLGLHIVQRLTELLGGRVGVESTPGAGSTFTVEVPCRRVGAGRRASA